MRTISILLFGVLASLTAITEAAGHECPTRGRCVLPPVPPTAPLPPIPDMPAMPDLPHLPHPPAPPAPPPLPAIPDRAHKACEGKAVGSSMTFSFRRKHTMTGSCQKDGRGMYFELNSYHVSN